MRLLLVDDHALFMQSLRFLLSELNPSIRCVTASSVAEAVRLPGPFDLVLLDFKLPDAQGFSGLHALRAALPLVPVTLLSGEESASVINAAISEGAMGFVPKSSSPEMLMAALQLILAGGAYLPPHARTASPTCGAGPLTGATHCGQRKAAGLSDRQLEVLLKVVQGKPNKVIAREMNLAEGTIKAHLSTAFRMLDVSNRTEAVFKAAQLGLTGSVH